jgi:hypothetical protein
MRHLLTYPAEVPHARRRRRTANLYRASSRANEA